MKKSDMTMEQINEAVDKLIDDPKICIFRKLWVAFIMDILNWIDKAEERRLWKALRETSRH